MALQVGKQEGADPLLGSTQVATAGLPSAKEESELSASGAQDHLQIAPSLRSHIKALGEASSLPEALRQVRQLPEFQSLPKGQWFELAIMSTSGTSLPGMDFNSSGYGLKKGSWGHIGTEHRLFVRREDAGVELLYQRKKHFQRAGSNLHWERSYSTADRSLKESGMSIFGWSWTDARFQKEVPFYTPARIEKGAAELLEQLETPAS